MSGDLYAQQIIELWRNPLNQGKLEQADACVNETNPLCGDEIELCLKLDGLGKKKTDSTVTDVKFSGHGCAISQACASLLTQDMKGKKLSEILDYSPKHVRDLLGVDISAARVKCAMLPLRAVKEACAKLSGEKVNLQGLYE